MVCIALSAVVCSGCKDMFQVPSFCYDEVELVPVLGPLIHPGHSVATFGAEVSIGDTELMIGTQFQKLLTVLITFSDTKVA